MKKSTAKQLNIGLIPATLILAVITLGFIMLVNSQAQPTTVNKIATPVVMETTPAIKNSAGLDAASAELDKFDPASVDQELSALNSDTSSF